MSKQYSSKLSVNSAKLLSSIHDWAKALGFQQIAITNANLERYEERYLAWLAKGFHGSMSYMEKHGTKRFRPKELIPNTIRIISARMDYLPPNTAMAYNLLDRRKAYISRYALGRDYHSLMRKRLAALTKKIAVALGQSSFRVFCDSAPVLEKAIAEKAGLGWIGKHTNVINAKAGSWFFLGEIYTDYPFPVDAPNEQKSHCGSCTACLQICPTQAIVAPYQLDARRCISYLTIEMRGIIPLELRPLIGNRIYGCDDCQIICPWNKFAKYSQEKDFYPRENLHQVSLIDLFNWSEKDFLHKLAGSAIRRIGFDCWLRNIAVALGNADFDPAIVDSLQKRLNFPSEIVREHAVWALERQFAKSQFSKI